MDENFATLLETVAGEAGDRTAIIHGDTRRTWTELDEHASRLAGFLSGRGIAAGDRVAIAMHNSPDYVEALFATMKVRAVPVNVNHRYRARELTEILGDSGASALFMDASLTREVAQAEATGLKAIVRIGEPEDGADPLREAVPFAAASASEPMPRIERSGGDHWLMFTGGTTGRPKGVLSRHTTLFSIAIPNGYRVMGAEPPSDLGGLRASTRRLLEHPRRMTALVPAPLMHATGVYSTFGVLLTGGTVVYPTSRSYDPEELAGLAARHRATDMCLVGDVFARPLATTLERAAREGRPYDLSALRRIFSVGVAWSAEVKERLLAHFDARLEDVIAASEGGPYARSVTTRSGRGGGPPRSTFELMPGARVIDEKGRDVVPGSGTIGRLAAPCSSDMCYLGDPEKSAATFVDIEGTRYSVPGDMATVQEDGSLILLGRGGRVINTGGEKVFAEEVEQVIAQCPGVADVTVVGLPDERWGHRIVAVVAPDPAAQRRPDAAQIQDAVATELAGYKKPRDVVFVEQVHRSPSGKPNLTWARETAAAHAAGRSESRDP
jgi:acyl-CoA synthetase (AMP-forming)/AMP-acid ligase II